jgi:hypothetical protein
MVPLCSLLAIRQYLTDGSSLHWGMHMMRVAHEYGLNSDYEDFRRQAINRQKFSKFADTERINVARR